MHTRTMKKPRLTLLACALLAFEAPAAGWVPDGWFLQDGVATHSAYTGGMKHPSPGENLLRLRYATRV
jgi:hypothetical protein